jgi:23S rRNA pseudouridine2605 synthase
MSDDRKKPARGGDGSSGRGRGPAKPFAARDGGKPRFGKPGDKTGGKPGAGKWKPREGAAEGAGDERRPRKPFTPRDGDTARSDRQHSGKPRFEGPRQPREGDGEAKKPFQRQDGMKRAFAKDGDGRPAKPRPGKWERREAATAEAGDGERRPRKPYAPRDGDRPKFDKPGFGGPRPERPRSDKPRSDKPRFDGPRKPRDGEADARPFRREDGEKRAFVKRGDRPGAAPRPGRRAPDVTQPVAGENEGSERIARRLARAGVSSRRDAEAMIADGRITLNGKVLDTPAVNVVASDRIEIDGKPIPDIERTRLFLFHKPAGVVTTNRDPEGRRTVFDVLPAGLPRLMTIGRLDINTEGLLLLTNDGGLSRVLELPATGWLRRYRVRVHGKVEPQALEGLKDGIAVDGVLYGGVEATLDREQGSNAWLTIGLREGKNREVKNILGALGLDVTRLIRISYGPFQLGELPEGELHELKGKHLREQLGERLIEEAGANFDAPVLTGFSNKDGAAAPARKEKPQVRPERRGEDRRDAKREDALGRLDTRKPSFGKPESGKPGGKFGDKFGDRPGAARAGDKGRFGGPKSGGGKPGFREDRPEEKPRSRTANVWMAPGAKPMGEKKKAAVEERSEGRRYAGKPRPAGKSAGKPGGKVGGKPGSGPSGRPAGRKPGPGGPRKPRGED